MFCSLFSVTSSSFRCNWMCSLVFCMNVEILLAIFEVLFCCRQYQAEWCGWHTEGKECHPEDFGSLERWAHANLIKFNKAKCKVLHMTQCHLKHKCKDDQRAEILFLWGQSERVGVVQPREESTPGRCFGSLEVAYRKTGERFYQGV